MWCRKGNWHWLYYKRYVLSLVWFRSHHKRNILFPVCYINQEMSKPKNVWHTICKDIHTRNLEERKEVTFYKWQAVGPTNKIVSQLRNFIGTIARNPRLIGLMYASLHVVPKDTKKRMWEYINVKTTTQWILHKQLPVS